MDEAIELSIDSADGVIDCRIEPVEDEGGEIYFSVTVLYPNMVNGFSRSEIYVYNMHRTGATGTYQFEGDEIHPKVKKLEGQLSGAIVKHVH